MLEAMRRAPAVRATRRLVAWSIAIPILALACAQTVEIAVPRDEPRDEPPAVPPQVPLGLEDAAAPNDASVGADADASPSEAGDSAISDTTIYAAICVSELANYEPSQAFRFRATLTRSGGDTSVHMAPLRGWDLDANTFVPPPSVKLSASEERESAFGPSPFVARPDPGIYRAAFDGVDLEEEANPISGRAATFSTLRLEGPLSQDAGDFCMTLSATLTKPYTANLSPEKNRCLFLRIPAGANLPDLDAGDFTCTF